MKKVFLTFLVLWSVSLFGAEIKWVENFSVAMQKAQKEHKPIIFIASKHGCKYCTMLKDTTLKDKSVIEKINKNFIALDLYLDESKNLVPYMVAVYTKGFPTIWFLDPNAKALFQPIGGYIDAKTMNQALDMVTQVYNDAQKKGKK